LTLGLIRLEDAAVAENRPRMEMFSVVGLTLDEVSSVLLPHNNLAKTLDHRKTKRTFDLQK